MADIKAIETHYNGYRFRSRLEARWAVFFDAAGIPYEYEPEGYVLSDGTCYLPDFYLPSLHMYLEIKHSNIQREERLEAMKKLEELFDGDCFKEEGNGIVVALAIGEPFEYDTYCYCHFGVKKENSFKSWFDFYFAKGTVGYSITYDCGFKFDKNFVSINVYGIQTEGEFSNSAFDPTSPLINGFQITKADYFKDAANKARQARFEHGECG